MRGLMDKVPGIISGITTVLPKVMDIIGTIRGIFGK